MNFGVLQFKVVELTLADLDISGGNITRGLDGMKAASLLFSIPSIDYDSD